MSPTTEAPTLARASGAGGGGRDRSGRHGAVGWAGLLLLTAVAAGLLGQGGFYMRVRWYVGVLVAAGAVLALVACPPTRDDARLPPVVAALFDFVWHLPAVLLTVTLLVGVVLPAPPGAGTRSPFRTAPGKESDEDKIAS
jgi:hypothetical protein